MNSLPKHLRLRMEETLKFENKPYYFYSACIVCLDTENVKFCSKCKIASYCHSDHQYDDWPYHKDFCKAVSNTHSSDPENTSPEVFLTVRNGKRFLLEKSLRRRLDNCESSMISNPKVCITCYTNKDLTTCPLCKCVSFCANHYEEDYSKHTNSSCSELKMAFEFYKFIWKNTSKIEIKVDSKIPEKALLAEATNFIKFTHAVPSEFKQKFKEYILGGTFNVINAFEKLNAIKNRQFFKESMTFHIIMPYYDMFGAMNFIKSFEFLFHWLNNLKHLKIVYFEDKVDVKTTKMNLSNTLKYMCDDCLKNKFIESERYNCEYHLQDGLDSPDLVFFFNMNLSDWEKAIPIMLQFATPICFTTYTSIEMEKQIKYLESFGIQSKNYLVKNEINPYYNRQPILNVDIGLQFRPIIYKDERISIIVTNDKIFDNVTKHESIYCT